MKTILLAFLFLCFALITACSKKRKDASLTATINEFGTKKPIPHVGVLVHYRDISEGIPGKSIPYDSIVSNADGKIFIDGSVHDPSSFKVYSRDTNYFDNWGGGGPSNSVTVGFINNPVIELSPYAWVKLRFIKKSDLDYIGTQRFSGEMFGFQIYTKDTIVIGRTYGNRTNHITIYPHKDGQAFQPYEESIFTPGHDTTYYEIEW